MLRICGRRRVGSGSSSQPLVSAVLALDRGAHIDTKEAGTLFISVIVPVRNERGSSSGTLSQLVGQDYDPDRFEVLVVHGESTDGTPDLVARVAAKHANVRLLGNPRRLPARRNIGAEPAATRC